MFQNSTQNTKSLLQKVAEGNENAFEKLFKTYDSQVNDYILGIIKSVPLAQEMVQDVFLKIWTNRRTLTEIGSFQSYLFIIARNHTLDCLKQINRKKKRENEWMNMTINHHTHDYCEVATDQSYEKVQQAVSLLPPQQKKIYALRRSGMKQSEIAQELSLSVETVKKHTMLAVRFLKNQLGTQVSVL